MTKAQSTRVVNATVRIDGKAGNSQGVLVPGGFILTATHCIDWSGEGGMAMGDHYIENVITSSGARLSITPYAADPLSDIAVMGAPDNQEFFDECEKFEEWREATAPVPLVNTTPRFRVPLGVHVRTHKGKWIEARIVRYSAEPPGGCLCLEADDRIEGGTSGGPIVESTGRLVGIVSWTSDAMIGRKYSGLLPIAHLALPQWVLRQIRAASRHQVTQ